MSLTLQRRGLVDEYNGYQFRRESMALDSAGKLIYTHNARFEQGPFGSDKGILVEEGTENLITSDKNMIKPIGTGTILIVEGGLPVGQYTISFDYDVAGETVPEGFLLYAFPKRALGTIPVTGLKGTTFLTFEVAEDVANTTIQLYGDISNATSLNKKVTFTNLQIEAKPYATTFTPSARANESLMVPIEGLLSPQQGTVEMWVKMPIYNNANFRTILNGYVNDGPLHFISLYRGDGRLYARYSSNGALTYLFTSVYNLPEWSLISLVYNDDGVKIYVNRELVGGNAAKMDEQAITKFMLGISASNNDFANGMIAHLRLSSIARTQEQLAPLDRPPEVDEYTTLYLPFNGADNTRAARSISI